MLPTRTQLRSWDGDSLAAAAPAIAAAGRSVYGAVSDLNQRCGRAGRRKGVERRRP